MLESRKERTTAYLPRLTPELREQQRLEDESWAKAEAEAQARAKARKTPSSAPQPTKK